MYLQWIELTCNALLCCFIALDCRDMIENAMILMGEIGGNDYNYALFNRKTVEEVKELVPLVVTTISSAITVNILDVLVSVLVLINFFEKLYTFILLLD